MAFEAQLRYSNGMYCASTRRRLIECLLIFVCLPLLIAWLKPRGYIYGILWLLMAFCAQLLQHQYGWKFKDDWNWKGLSGKEVKRIVLRFIPFGAALLWFTWYTIPGELFSLPNRSLIMWATIMVVYPPLSILPQEVIYRSFFLRRYTPLVRNPDHVRILCALAFGWMHVIMLNWPAVVFSAIGGLLFADTYQRSKSLAAVCFEHMLYGCFLFTIGLGYYFFHGNAMR
jgi:hypothetical protein